MMIPCVQHLCCYIRVRKRQTVVTFMVKGTKGKSVIQDEKKGNEAEDMLPQPLAELTVPAAPAVILIYPPLPPPPVPTQPQFPMLGIRKWSDWRHLLTGATRKSCVSSLGTGT